MSQEFNSDPQGWELTDKFGDRSVRIWLEILAILDREKNHWKLVDGWDSVISRKVRQSSGTVRRVVDWMLANGWLEVGQLSASNQPEVLLARNYPKYHKTRSEVSPAPNLTYPNHPNLSEPKDPDPAPPAPSADSKKKELDPRIKAVADRIYKSNPVKFARLIQWIKQAEKYDYPAPVIAQTLERFESHSDEVASWYPWLDKVIEKLKADYNRDLSLVEHEQHKTELKETAQIFDFRSMVKDA